MKQFPFASRIAPPSAPLFYSGANDFREEDEGEEHDREVADLHALQRSRRDFGTGRLSESSDEDRYFGEERRLGDGETASDRLQRKGIRSSWIGYDSEASSRPANNLAGVDANRAGNDTASEASDRLTELEMTATSRGQAKVSPSMETTGDDDPPSLQHIRTTTHWCIHQQNQDEGSSHSPGQTEQDINFQNATPVGTVTHFDSVFGTLFLIAMAAMFASFVFVLLHTTTTDRSKRLRGTIYVTIHDNISLLGIDTMVAISVSALWIAGIRAYVRPIVLLMLGAVPVVALVTSVYLLFASYAGVTDSANFQGRLMRWVAVGPLIFALVWTFAALRGVHNIDRAADLLKLTTRILGDCPVLLLTGFITLCITVAWIWLFLLIFARIFLTYQPGGVIWWVAAFATFTFAWSLKMLSGLQRAVVAALVSDWYFYRHHAANTSSAVIASAAFTHSTERLFGTVCLSALVSLLLRLPYLLLPSRLLSGFALALSPFRVATTAALTNPLVLTYASTHSRKYSESANRLWELALDKRKNASFVALARLFLHAQRLCASLAFGFGGWVSAAKMTAGGSRNAYVVGLAAGGIGWTVLGCAENVIGQVMDSVLICWASEGDSEARFCVEAHNILQDGNDLEV